MKQDLKARMSASRKENGTGSPTSVKSADSPSTAAPPTAAARTVSRLSLELPATVIDLPKTPVVEEKPKKTGWLRKNSKNGASKKK
jgi:hypothetical protein